MLHAPYGSTRGLRNRNPGNLRPCPLPDVWDGQVGIDENEGGPFSIFGDMNGREADFWGIRACARNFYSYQEKDGCNTIGEIIHRHAPPSENDTKQYIELVCNRLGGFDPTDEVCLKEDPVLTLRLIQAVCQEEEGTDPYPDALVASAIAAA